MKRAIAMATLLGSLMACGRSSQVTNVTSDAATPVVDAAPPAPVVHASVPIPPRPPLAPCRAIAARGRILASHEADGGTRDIATGDPIDAWLDLDAAARVTVKEPRTGRELLFVGAASAIPCVHESEAWLMRGEFTSARGSGESPGAEQWVVTPYAVVRYGAAIVDVKVDADSTRAVLKGGGASALADGGDSWHALDPSVPLVARGTGAGDDPNAASDRCAQTSAAAKALEDQLLAPGETRDPSFGDLAKRTTEARILARAVCAMKAVRMAMRAPGLSPSPAPPPP